MHDRIRTFAALATTEHTSYYDGRGNVTETVFDKEKFAELIVRECAGRVDHILREKKDGGGTMADEIRKHFGVAP